jgi:carbon storage regulator
MLVLSRKPGEKVLIGDHISITIVRIGPNTVRLGIEAPKNMNIVREELTVELAEGDEIESSELLAALTS